MTKLEIEDSMYAWLDRALKKMDFFSNLTVQQLEIILNAICLYSYPKSTTIFKQGDLGDAMYVVFQGGVAISQKSGMLSFSKKITRLGTGQIFGEMALFDASPRNATAATEEESKIFSLLKGDFEYILSKNPDLANHLQRLIARRKYELNQQ